MTKGKVEKRVGRKGATEKSTARKSVGERLKAWWRKNRRTVVFAVFVVAWAVFVTIGCQMVIGWLMAWILKLCGQDFAAPFWTMVFYILYYAATLALIILVPPRLVITMSRGHERKFEASLETSPQEMGVASWPTFVDMGLAPVGYVVYIGLATLATNLMSQLSWFDAEQAQNVGFPYFLNTGERLAAILAVVIIAPIAEELIMRGWLYGKLRDKMGWVLAMVIVSATFGVMHGQWNVGIVTFILSLILCGLREITGTIWSGILLHVLVNGIAFYVTYVVGVV